MIKQENKNPKRGASETKKTAPERILSGMHVGKTARPKWFSALLSLVRTLAGISAIFRGKQIPSSLEKASLMHRPLVASFVILPKMEGNSSSFAGHLCVDNLRLQLQREMKEAVSTSHCSQPNTIEHEMGNEWRLLQSRSDSWWNRLYRLTSSGNGVLPISSIGAMQDFCSIDTYKVINLERDITSSKNPLIGFKWDIQIKSRYFDYGYNEEYSASNEGCEYDYGHYNDEHEARSTHGSYGETNDLEEPYDDHHDLEGTSTYNSYSSCDEHSDEGIGLEYDDSEVSSAYDEGESQGQRSQLIAMLCLSVVVLLARPQVVPSNELIMEA
ncbi:hypothetical protein RND71_022343 [Anisodus tanguticus]|uniref:Uncharacterized protein n=1 Tax=Anisodus tanguticus TaxID=243964 RepID=A0AAE1VG45_9SOLA|nr:hypothetical protein RND71_022343 [Anisodus tanguticus]